MTTKRPIAPHLQVYKWGPHMVVSILHRATGDGMALVGASLLVACLVSAAIGPEAYGRFVALMISIPGYIVMVGLTLVFFQHLCSGLRHLYMDTGSGLQPDENRLLAVATLVASPLLTALTWALILLR